MTWYLSMEKDRILVEDINSMVEILFLHSCDDDDAGDERFERCDSHRSHSDYVMSFPALQWRRGRVGGAWGCGVWGWVQGQGQGGLKCAMN